MAGLARWSLSPETRAKFVALLDEAQRLGIDRDEVAAGGLPGLRALVALKQAAESATKKTRDRALAEVQDAVHTLAHRKYPKLVSQFQARILALQGRGSDTEVAHVARGEVVVPEALQNPKVLAALHEAAALKGVAVGRLRVGSPQSDHNPDTGVPEFGVIDTVRNWFTSPAPTMAEHAPMIPDVNAPTARTPTYEDLQFDPNGPKERDFFRAHPIDTAKAMIAIGRGLVDTGGTFGSGPLDYKAALRQNDDVDAHRHAVISHLMAQSIGPERAKELMDAHERSSPNQEGTRLMDLYNNQVGRSAPEDAPINFLNPGRAIQDAATRGFLRKSPFGK